MIHGPDISVLREAAKTAVMVTFVREAELDGVLPTLRIMYVLKVGEARLVLEGGQSDYITGEAKLRGVAEKDIAERIVALAKQSVDLELERMQVNTRIDAAVDASAVSAIMVELGIPFTVDV